MSDLCIYQLEDNVWGELGTSDDHIVPHPCKENKEQFPTRGDKGKKQRQELIGFSSKTNSRTIYDNQRIEENNLPYMSKKVQMPEKDSWSDTPDGVFPASCDSNTIKEVVNAACHDNVTSTPGLKSSYMNKFCVDDPLLDGSSSAVDDSLYSHPLNHISQTDNDLSFLCNDREDKESSDLLFSGWPDIGSFEDVDRMFRSCDSTFGLGSLGEEDDLCWFSSTNAAEGSEDVLKSPSNLDDSSQHQKSSRGNCTEISTNDCDKKNADAVHKSMGADGAVPNHMSFVNGLDAESESKGVSVCTEQEQVKRNNLHKKQLKNQNLSEGKSEDGHLENGCCLPQYVEVNKFNGLDHQSQDSSSQVLSTSGLQHNKQKTEPNTLRHMQTKIPYLNFDYSNSSDHISVYPAPSGTLSENNCGMSPSLKESSDASNQALSLESSHGQFEVPFMTTHKRGEKLYQGHDLWVPSARNFNNGNVANPKAFANSLSVQKQVVPSELEMEGHSEIDGITNGVQAELESSNVQESSSMSSMVDDISLEASGFRQLQQVMEKLDIRTKLCIRDSLYRLARSAEQRHNSVNSSSSMKHDREASGALSNETNRNNTHKSSPPPKSHLSGFIDIETNTNPIDRSIAHLLFHRPLDISVMPAKDAVSFNSHATVHESITSSPAKGEIENFPNDANKKLVTSNGEFK